MTSMGDRLSKCPRDDLYLETEFTVMDTDKDGLLSIREFTNLLLALGFGGDEGQTELLLKKMNKGQRNKISKSEYVQALKSNDDVIISTSRWRVIYESFDDAHEGRVANSEVEQRLITMGFQNMKNNIEETDENKDGYITYEEFFRKHLKDHGLIV